MFRLMPTRGGRLAIVNGLFWVFLLIGPGLDVLPAPVAWGLALVMSLPIALLCIPLSLGRVDSQPVTDALVCVVIGCNSLLWGYGLSWLWSKAGGRRAMNPVKAPAPAPAPLNPPPL